jgi:hypothetical protein
VTEVPSCINHVNIGAKTLFGRDIAEFGNLKEIVKPDKPYTSAKDLLGANLSSVQSVTLGVLFSRSSLTRFAIRFGLTSITHCPLRTGEHPHSSMRGW